MKNKNVELHLFILWENALYKKKHIIDKIKNKFSIIEVYLITWPINNFNSNLSRFYGEKLPQGSKKEVHCGKGPFLAILVYDFNPVYKYRNTSKGSKLVNINTFDAKQRFRKITGGGHRIHSTNSILESKHDIMLLFGVKYENILNKNQIWNGDVVQFNNNIIGYNGWDSFEQFFMVLNETIDYVILRNFKNLSSCDDIDFLTTSLKEFVYISNAKKIITYSFINRVQYSITVDNANYHIDIRSIGDNYYDRKWQKEIIEDRVFSEGFYIPSRKHFKYSLLYHYMAHKKIFLPNYLLNLSELFKKLELNSLLEDLKIFMHKNQYQFVSPKDLSVSVNHRYIPMSYSMKMYYFLRCVYVFKNMLYSNLQSIIWYIVNFKSFKKKLKLNEKVESLSIYNMRNWHHGSFHFIGFNNECNAKVFIKTDFMFNLLNNEIEAFNILYKDKGIPFKIPKVISTTQSNNFHVIQYEYIQGAVNLNQFVKQKSGNKKLLKTILTRLVNGVKYINEKGLIHRDINPKNILLKQNNSSEEFDIYIIDFLFMMGFENTRFKELDISNSKRFLKYLGNRNKPSNLKWDDMYSLYCIAYKTLGVEADEIADWKNLINRYTYTIST